MSGGELFDTRNEVNVLDDLTQFLSSGDALAVVLRFERQLQHRG